MHMWNRGSLIVFEGIDRCGKSTQSKLLADDLNSRGKETVHMSFPNRTTAIGQMINLYLTSSTKASDEAVHLLFSANRWEAKKQIEKMLESGVNVVVDRYAYSGVVYTAAKGFDVEWCKNADTGLPKPDVVFYLKLDVKDAMERADYGKERYETYDFQTKVKKFYEEHMLETDDVWTSLDASESVSVLQEKIRQISDRTIENSRTESIAYLWE